MKIQVHLGLFFVLLNLRRDLEGSELNKAMDSFHPAVIGPVLFVAVHLLTATGVWLYRRRQNGRRAMYLSGNAHLSGLSLSIWKGISWLSSLGSTSSSSLHLCYLSRTDSCMEVMYGNVDILLLRQSVILLSPSAVNVSVHCNIAYKIAHRALNHHFRVCF